MTTQGAFAESTNKRAVHPGARNWRLFAVHCTGLSVYWRRLCPQSSEGMSMLAWTWWRCVRNACWRKR